MADVTIRILTRDQASSELSKIDSAFSKFSRGVLDAGRNLDKWIAELKASAPEARAFYDRIQDVARALDNAEITTGEARAALEKIRAEMRATGLAGEEAAQGNKKFGLSITDINSALEISRKVIEVAKQAYDRLITSTVNYAMEVKDAARAMGANAEEASKLIQVANDVRLSQDTLKIAFRQLNDAGIAPNIANLQKLSDQYLAITDPVKQAQFAADNFGQRAGPEMQKLLELGSQAIGDMAQSAQDAGQVLDDEAVQAADDFRVSLDNLGDSIEGVTLKTGSQLIPVLNSYATLANNIITLTDKFNFKLIDQKNALEDSLNIMSKWGGLPIFGQFKLLNDLVTIANGLFAKETKAETGAAAAAREHAAAIERQNRARLGGTEGQGLREAEQRDIVYKAQERMATQREEKESLHDLDDAQKKVADQFLGFSTENYIAGMNAAAERNRELREANDKLREQLESELPQAQEALAKAQQDWNRSVGTDAVNALEKLRVSQEKDLEIKGAIDRALGTNFVEQANYNNQLNQLIKDVASGKITQEQFEKGLQGIAKGFSDLSPQLEDAKQKLTDVMNGLNAVNGKHVTATVDVVMNMAGLTWMQNQAGSTDFLQGTNPGAGQNQRGATPIPQAAGGDWWVTSPTLFMAGESGPERATFTPAYRPVPSGGVTRVTNVIYNIYDEGAQALAMADRDRLQGERLDESMGE